MSHIMNTYARYNVEFVRGEGSRLYDAAGKEYIDFGSGIAVNSVGYAHPKWVDAVSVQAATLAHVSNLYHTQPAAKLAEKLCSLSGMSEIFFCNSGAEANEGAIKLARKYSCDKYGAGRHTIVTLNNSFHGRTLAALSATGQPKFHEHFHPFVEGFVHVPINDMAALEALDSSTICAVMVEPVQGESGIWPLCQEYWNALRKLCDERDWLLIADEVQTGIGRCGDWMAYQVLGTSPDIVTIAKGLAGGLPLGAFLANEKCAGTLTPGTHGTTFGGNPVCCAAALAVLDILEENSLSLKQRTQVLTEGLRNLFPNAPIRGMGMMIGVQVGEQVRDIVQRGLDNGVITLTAGTDVLRFLPPLTITEEEICEGLARLKKAIVNVTFSSSK